MHLYRRHIMRKKFLVYANNKDEDKPINASVQSE